jgi:hypothetical protein
MKIKLSIILGLLLIAILLYNKYDYCNYLKSLKFNEDVFYFENEIRGYERVFVNKPNIDAKFLKSIKKFTDTSKSYNLNSKFFKRKIRSIEVDSLYIIYLWGNKSKKGTLFNSMPLNEVKWWNLFRYNDIIIDTMMLKSIDDNNFKRISLIKDGEIVKNVKMIRQIAILLKKYSDTLRKNKVANEWQIDYFRFDIKDGRGKLLLVSDKSGTLKNNSTFKENLIQEMIQIEGIENYDQIYFPFRVYQLIVKNHIQKKFGKKIDS